MRAFQDYDIVWKEKTFVIPSGQLLPVIAAVEDYITLTELMAVNAHGRVSAARLSQAYTVILRAAGVKGLDNKTLIGEQEVYANLFETDGADVFARMKVAFDGLCTLMIPPKDLQGEPAAPGKREAAPGSSKKSTKRSLARAG